MLSHNILCEKLTPQMLERVSQYITLTISVMSTTAPKFIRAFTADKDPSFTA